MEESDWRFVVEVVVDSREAGFEGHGEGEKKNGEDGVFEDED